MSDVKPWMLEAGREIAMVDVPMPRDSRDVRHFADLRETYRKAVAGIIAKRAPVASFGICPKCGVCQVSPAAAPATREEAAWLIEHPRQPMWLGACASTGGIRWGMANQAVRFSRREDATMMARALDLPEQPKITEHGWGLTMKDEDLADAELRRRLDAAKAALRAVIERIDEAVDGKIHTGRMEPIAGLLSEIQDGARHALLDATDGPCAGRRSAREAAQAERGMVDP